MSQFSLSERSKANLQQVHPLLISCVESAIQTTDIDFVVIEGLRSFDRQRELISKGVSWTLKSKHLIQPDGYGHAVDLAPLVGGEIPWGQWYYFQAIADAMKAAADLHGAVIIWGGDWKTHKDGPHFQIELEN